MRFYIVEATNTELQELDTQFKEAVNNRDWALARQLGAQYLQEDITMSKLLPVEDLAVRSMIAFSNCNPSRKTNPFLYLLKTPLRGLDYSNINVKQNLTTVLNKMIPSDKFIRNVFNDSDYPYTKPSLYKRSIEDFEYTTAIFDVLNDPQQLNKYFDLSIDGAREEITPNALMQGSRVRQAKVGEKNLAKGGIYAIIEDWSNRFGKKVSADRKSEKSRGKEISFKDILSETNNQTGARIEDNPKDSINLFFKIREGNNAPQLSSEVSAPQLLKLLNKTFTVGNLKTGLTDKEYQDIKDYFSKQGMLA